MLTGKEAFAGIDVAFAKGKRLPVCVCRWEGARLQTLALRTPDLPEPPRGRGNRAVLDANAVYAFAVKTLTYLRALERALDIRVVRVAIDASRAPKTEGTRRREAECAMDRRRISCIPTPSLAELERIREKAHTHLEVGGAEGGIPHANQLWMLAGFELFRVLGEVYECLEVYPQATVRLLGCHGGSKLTRHGLREQYRAAGRATGWNDMPLELAQAAYGAPHDRLDAYLAAWVASLPEERRVACGSPPDDVIWIPALEEPA